MDAGDEKCYYELAVSAAVDTWGDEKLNSRVCNQIQILIAGKKREGEYMEESLNMSKDRTNDNMKNEFMEEWSRNYQVSIQYSEGVYFLK